MRSKITAILAPVVALVLLTSCKSVTSPTPTCQDPKAINFGQPGDCKFPTPLAGTVVQTFPLPGTDKLMFVWITGISPVKDSQLTPGQPAFVRWTCAGPAGYSAWISKHFITAGQSTDLKDSSGGSGINFATDCGSATSSLPSGTTGDIVSFQLLVWTAQGGTTIVIPYPADRPAEYVREEPLGWKMPQ